MDTKKLREEQLKLAKEIIIEDRFPKIELIAGVDQAVTDNKIISAIVLCDFKTMEVIEKEYAVVEAKVPYIPGYLAYREMPAAIEAFNKLEKKPDIILVDANGILHPRRIGMASHLGLILDTATIGVAKKLLLGEVKDDKVYVRGEQRAALVYTRKGSRPIYVSPGHKVSFDSAVFVVNECTKQPHKLPEPLALAHKYVNKLRKEI